MKLSNKVILITGSGTGLGKEIALRAAAEGATVALLGRTESELLTVKKAIIATRGKADFFLCDIRDERAVQKTVEKILKTFGQIDILVNNAGVWTDEELEAKDSSRRKLALETNALGTINVTYALLPHFREKNGGHIFNVISTAGASDTPAGNNAFWKTYGASKWAVTGFTKALREDLLKTKIRVTAFHPGGFDSMLYEKAKRKDAHNQPWMMKAGDLADIVLFALTRPPGVMMEKIIVTKI